MGVNNHNYCCLEACMTMAFLAIWHMLDRPINCYLLRTSQNSVANETTSCFIKGLCR